MTALRVAATVLVLGALIAAVYGVRSRRRWGRWLSVMAGTALVALVVVAADPSAVRAAVRREWLVITGQLVDVGGYRLRLDCSGAGEPTVVLDAGLCQTRETWGVVPSEVARFTRVCSYDRASLGDSDAGPTPRTSQLIVEELHTLLVNGGIGRPYVLVGHSFAGLNVRLYASSYPDDVVGMVLVDASHENQYSQVAAMLAPSESETYLKHESGDNCERVDMVASGAQIRAAEQIPSMPLVVLSAQQESVESTDPRMVGLHGDLQAELARLVPGARQIIADGSGHFVQLDQPEVVVGAIREVVDAVRQK